MAPISLQDFREVFDRLLAGLPSGSALLEFSEKEGRLQVRVQPANTGAAEIRAILDPDGVTLLIGRGAVFEIPETGRYTNFSCLEEVYALCMAVAAGKFEEIVTSAGSKVVGARAKIDLGNDVASGVWREFVFLPFRRKRKDHLKYSAYF